MNHSVKWMGAVAALLLSAAGALGQSAPAADQLPAGSQLQHAAPQPKGIPGYLDPATGLFQPLPRPEAAGTTTYSGTIEVSIAAHLQRILQTANLQCAIDVQFGSVNGTDFFNDQSTNVIFSFSAQSPPTINIPFIYKTSNQQPKFQAKLSCQTTAGGPSGQHFTPASGASDLTLFFQDANEIETSHSPLTVRNGVTRLTASTTS